MSAELPVEVPGTVVEAPASAEAPATAEASASARDPAVDWVRGLAVVLMLLANLSPELTVAPRPWAYRALSSFCAPAFVFLSGLMIGQKGGQLKATLERSFWLLALASLIDWGAFGLRPFTSFDVLYLVALASPFWLSASREKPLRSLQYGLLVFALRGYVQKLWPTLPLQGELESLLRHGLLTGWFPLFPWAGLGFFGVFVGQLYQGKSKQELSLGLAFCAAATLAYGLGEVDLSQLRERGGYAELFYPPSFSLLAFVAGLTLLLLPVGRRFAALAPSRLLLLFGRSSLFVYVLHLFLIGRIVPLLGLQPSLQQLALGFLALFICSLMGLGLLRKCPRKPRFTLLRILRGGA